MSKQAKIGFYDYGGGGFARKLPTAAKQLKLGEPVHGASGPADLVGRPIAIAHFEHDAEWQRLVSDSRRGSVRLRVSSVGFPDPKPPYKTDGGVYVFHLLRPSASTEATGWKDILRVLNSKSTCNSITRGEDVGVWAGYFISRRSLVLPALAILCQGYLAVYASSVKTRDMLGQRLQMTLSNMGFTPSIAKLVQDQMARLRDNRLLCEVSSPEWWWRVFGKTRRKALAFMIDASQKEWGAVSR